MIINGTDIFPLDDRGYTLATKPPTVDTTPKVTTVNPISNFIDNLPWVKGDPSGLARILTIGGGVFLILKILR